MRNPFRRKALTATPAVIDALRGGEWSPWPLLGGGNRQRILDAYTTAQNANYSWLYANSPALRKVVDVLVRNIGQLDLRLYEEISADAREPRPDHPAALSMRYPSEKVTQDKFIRSMVKDFLLYDNAYALIQPATGGQVSLFRIPVHLIQLLGASLFEVELYRYWPANGGQYQDFQPDRIMHWSGENPDDPRWGISRLDTLRDVIAEDVALRQATIELANAGLTEPVWAFRPLEAPLMDARTEQGLEEDLTNRLRRRNRRVVVTQEGTELKSFGVSPKDAQMMEIRKWVGTEVASVYGVPLAMIGLADNIAEARDEFYTDTLPPYCEDFTKMLNQRLLVRVFNWTDGCFEFNLDEKHMGDDRIKSLVSGSGRAVFTTNEARARLNLPPVDVGEELVTPLNVIVGENPKPTPQVMPPQDPNKPDQGGGYREQPKSLQKAAEIPEEPRQATYEKLPQLHPGRKADLDRQHRNIDLSKAVIEKHFNRLERSLRNKSATDWKRWDREFADDIFGLVKQIVETEGTIYAFKLAGQFAMEYVSHYLRAMAEGAAEGINAKIREEIDTLGLDDALARRPQHVESAGAGLGANATMWARMEAARQSPDVEHRVKTWIPDTDRHAEFGGDTVPVGDPWPAGFAPGSAPGCRCTMSIQ